MKRAEVELSDPLFQQIASLAEQHQLSVSEVLRQAAEQLVLSQPQPETRQQDENWRFPEPRHLGQFLSVPEDWRLLANEAAS